jgi:hypothetical protein
MSFSAKTPILFISLSVMLLVSFAFSNRSNEQKNYATMRTIESALGNFSKIMIVYEDGKTEEIALERSASTNLLNNAILINNSINAISSKGYELVSSHGIGDQVTTYTFVKK